MSIRMEMEGMIQGIREAREKLVNIAERKGAGVN